MTYSIVLSLPIVCLINDDLLRSMAGLRERADSAVDRLQKLKQRGEKGLESDKSTSTRQLLKGVEDDLNDSIRSLRAWIVQFEKGSQANNASTVETIVNRFDHLDQRIHDVSTALGSRLQHRRLWLIDHILHKRSGFHSRWTTLC